MGPRIALSRRRRRALGAACLVVALVGGACRDAPPVGPPVPDGHVRAEHRDGDVTLPGGWVPVADTAWARIDPGAVEYTPADASADLPVAVVLWRHDERTPPGLIRLPVDLVARHVQLLGVPGFVRVRDDPVDVPGAREAHLVHYRFWSDVHGAQIVTTLVAARVGSDEVLLLRLSGPEHHVTEQLVETVVGTFRVTADP